MPSSTPPIVVLPPRSSAPPVIVLPPRSSTLLAGLKPSPVIILSPRHRTDRIEATTFILPLDRTCHRSSSSLPDRAHHWLDWSPPRSSSSLHATALPKSRSPPSSSLHHRHRLPPWFLPLPSSLSLSPSLSSSLMVVASPRAATVVVAPPLPPLLLLRLHLCHRSSLTSVGPRSLGYGSLSLIVDCRLPPSLHHCRHRYVVVALPPPPPKSVGPWSLRYGSLWLSLSQSTCRSPSLHSHRRPLPSRYPSLSLCVGFTWELEDQQTTIFNFFNFYKFFIFCSLFLIDFSH